MQNISFKSTKNSPGFATDYLCRSVLKQLTSSQTGGIQFRSRYETHTKRVIWRMYVYASKVDLTLED